MKEPARDEMIEGIASGVSGYLNHIRRAKEWERSAAQAYREFLEAVTEGVAKGTREAALHEHKT